MLKILSFLCRVICCVVVLFRSIRLTFTNALLNSEPSRASKPKFDFQKAAMGAFAAMTIASNVMTAPANALDTFGPFSSSMILSEKVVREGLYREYEVDLVQETDDARSTFKAKEETKSKKGKCDESLRG